MEAMATKERRGPESRAFLCSFCAMA